MKIEFDKKLFKYALYIAVTAVALYVSFLIISNLGSILSSIVKFFSYIFDLLYPLIIGIVIAYLLFPIMKLIENFLLKNRIYPIKKLSNRRVIAIFLSYISVLSIIIALLCGIYFMIGGQISKNTTISVIIDDIYAYFGNHPLSPSSIKHTLENLNLPFIGSLEPYIIDTVKYIQEYLSSNLGNITSYAVSIGSGVANFFIALIISIYLLKDYEYFVDLFQKLYKLIFRDSNLGNKIIYTFSIINDVFGKFIRGQLLEAFFVGLLSAIALSLVGIDYAFVIGIIAGICNMIPYVGPLVGTVLAAIMGLLSGNLIKIVYAIVAMLIVQQIDNNLLAPKIVGNSVGLHAVFTMMAILIGGNIGGLIGMLFAVPIAASFKVLFNNWYADYLKTHESKKDTNTKSN